MTVELLFHNYSNPNNISFRDFQPCVCDVYYDSGCCGEGIHVFDDHCYHYGDASVCDPYFSITATDYSVSRRWFIRSQTFWDTSVIVFNESGFLNPMIITGLTIVSSHSQKINKYYYLV